MAQLRGIDVIGQGLMRGIPGLADALAKLTDEQRRREEVQSIVNGLMARSSGLPSKQGTYIGEAPTQATPGTPMFSMQNFGQLGRLGEISPQSLAALKMTQPEPQVMSGFRGSLDLATKQPWGDVSISNLRPPAPNDRIAGMNVKWIDKMKDGKRETFTVPGTDDTKVVQVAVDASTGQPIPGWERLTPGGAPPAMSGGQRQDAYEMRLASAFRSEPIVKDYMTTTGRVEQMRQALDEAKTTGNFVAVDQAIITLFNKIMDPSSVVRESEYARTPEDAALMNRAKAAYNRLLSGGRISDSDRQAMVTMANRFANAANKKYQTVRKDYWDRSKRYGFEPFNVVGYDPNAEGLEAVPQSQGQAVPGSSQSQSGTRSIWTTAPEELTDEELEALLQEGGYK